MPAISLLILARMLLVVLALLATLTRYIDLQRGFNLAMIPLSTLILLTAYMFVNFIYALSEPVKNSAKRGIFLFVQFIVDVLFISAFSFFTGGLASNFLYLHFVLIIASSILLARRASAFFASCATVGMAAVMFLHSTETGKEWIDPAFFAEASRPMPAMITRLLAIATALYVIAYLSELLAGRLETVRNLNDEVLQTMSEGVAVFDEQHTIVFCNPEFRRLFCDELEVSEGTTAQEIFSGSPHAFLIRLLQKDETGHFELAENEETPPMEVRLSSLQTQGKTRGMLMLVIDLSAIKRAETAERLADRFCAINEMAAGLAHEIRNPLASVRGSIQEIRSEFEPDNPNYQLAQIVLEESDRLDKIITDFLHFARQRSLRMRPTRLGTLLEETKLLLASRPDAAKVTIDLKITDDPEISCDPEQMREVFMNLGINALSAMSGTGGGTLTIKYPCQRPRVSATTILRKMENRGITLSFHDKGPGIPEGMEHRIFEPFFTTKEKGGGLGLSIALRIIESHMGSLWAANAPGGGAIFYIWLPAQSNTAKLPHRPEPETSA